jgi:ribosome-associated heat shock protein Hsp15
LRIDKWLFFARIFKTRNRAVRSIEKGLVFLNGKRVAKQSQVIKIGDGIILKGSKEILELKVMNFGMRRESYDIARHMYDNTVQESLESVKEADSRGLPGSKQSVRPDKKDRRALIELKRASNVLKGE